MDWTNKLNSRQPPLGFNPQTPMNNAVQFNASYVSPYTSPLSGQRSVYLPPQPLLPPNLNNGLNSPGSSAENLDKSGVNPLVNIDDRYSYYLSSLPLYCSDWSYLSDFDTDCVALSTYKEGVNNKIHILHGIKYGREATIENDDPNFFLNDDVIEGFDFHKVGEISVDYPVTNLQWDPTLTKTSHKSNERLAASSEVLRLYQVDHDNFESNNEFKLKQTHFLTNNTTSGTSSQRTHSPKGSDIMTCPPVTSFDWNNLDNSLIITASVDTTCTVWDLNRSVSNEGRKDSSAHVKTQLIAHDSEVFDVKFLNDSTNLFASVGNDGSMRVFDLRSLEHSTIIYEPPNAATALSNPGSRSNVINKSDNSNYNSKALIKLACSNIDQNYLATVGVNSNQVIIIDTRMPGMPVSIIDGSLGGISNTSINSIKWHPNSNFLLTGGDDCQALIWDCNNLYQHSNKPEDKSYMINSPVLAYQEQLEINNVCWRGDKGDWMGVVSGKGFQAVLL